MAWHLLPNQVVHVSEDRRVLWDKDESSNDAARVLQAARDSNND